MTLIWTPLIYLMVKIVCRIVKDKGAAATQSIAEPRFLDQKMIGRPSPRWKWFPTRRRASPILCAACSIK